MVKNLCVSIPVELRKYQKVATEGNITIRNSNSLPFGVKIVRNSEGELEYSAYYSDNGELLKKVFYRGSTIIAITHYRNSLLSSKEEYLDNKISNKIVYDKKGNVVSTTRYCYNRTDKITSIRKNCRGDVYCVEYGYDELDRVNSRKISLNTNVIKQQTYKYDILDRIVEYQDDTQKIKIMRLSKKNELVSYTITDKIGNDILISNKFDICGNYETTIIQLNGHEISVNDKNYLDNIILKKPYTTEDDLDFTISNLLHENNSTKRVFSNDISDRIIANNMQNIKEKVLPISIRKRILYNNTN